MLRHLRSSLYLFRGHGICLLVILAGLLLGPRSHGQETDPEGWHLAIFAQTDSRAELEPCACPGLESSGLALRARILRKARRLKHPAVVVDGGDFVPGPGESLRVERAELMLDVMERLGYDAVGIGDLDLLLGPEFISRAAARLPLVSANLQLGDHLDIEIPRVRWVTHGHRRIAITSFMDPAVFYCWPDVFETHGEDFVILDVEESLASLLQKLREEADVIVLLGHAPIEQMTGYLDVLPTVDVVIQGHDPQETTAHIILAGTPVMIPGPHSREVAQLTIEVLETGKSRPLRSRLWDLKQQPGGDPDIDALVSEFVHRHGSP